MPGFFVPQHHNERSYALFPCSIQHKQTKIIAGTSLPTTCVKWNGFPAKAAPRAAPFFQFFAS
jgi:hypothetical protein